MLSDFGNILLYIITAIAFTLAMWGIASFIRPHKPTTEKLATYESGEEPEGNANVLFNVRYYVVALVFVLFEVELVFLFPWATVFANKQLIEASNGLWAWFALAEAFLFVTILALGLAYIWVKGHLDWVMPPPPINEIVSNIPINLYENVNEKYANQAI